MSSAAKVYFGVADLQTAQAVSAMLGKSTIIVESGGTGRSSGSNSGWPEGHHGGKHSGGRNWGWSENDNWQQAPRDLLNAPEVMALPPRVAITFPGGGVPPVCTRLIRYFEEPRLARLVNGGGRLSRAAAACLTVIRSAFILALGIGLAVMLTEALQAQAWPQFTFPPLPGPDMEQAPALPGTAPGPIPAPAAVPTPASSPVRPAIAHGPITRAQLARQVAQGGYGSLDDAQEAACLGFYLSDLRKLRRAVAERVQVSLAAIPGFQHRPQYAQMIRALQLLDQAIADLQQQGTATDCTRYQGLIDEVDQALRRP